MAITVLTNGEQYTIGKVAGNAVVLDGTDHKHGTMVVNNKIEVTYSGSNNHEGLTITNGGAGTADCLIRLKEPSNAFWNIGIDSSDGDKLKMSNVHSFADGAGDFQLSTAGNLTIGGYYDGDWHIEHTDAGETYASKIYNNNDDASAARCLLLSGGENAGTTSGNTNYIMKLVDGDGGELAYVTYVNTNVTWGSFTGAHPAYIKPDQSSPILETQTASGQAHDEFKVGMIVRTVSTSTTTTGSYQPLHHMTTSSIFQDKQVLGVYGGSMGALAEDDERMHQHNVWSIGDGMIYVCNENGNVEIGDYITTASGSAGYGCKQNDDVLHNYTVAKALENVDWSTETSSSKLIPCTIHCG